MLWTVAFVLFALWLVGIVTAHAFGGLLHILLVLAVVAIVVNVINGRTARA